MRVLFLFALALLITTAPAQADSTTDARVAIALASSAAKSVATNAIVCPVDGPACSCGCTTGGICTCLVAKKLPARPKAIKKKKTVRKFRTVTTCGPNGCTTTRVPVTTSNYAPSVGGCANGSCSGGSCSGGSCSGGTGGRTRLFGRWR